MTNTDTYSALTYYDLELTDYGPGGADDPSGWQTHEFTEMLVETGAYALPSLRQGLQIGDEVAFRAQLIVPQDPDEMIGFFDNGGRALSCNLAGVDCTAGVTATHPSGSMLFGEYRSLSFTPEPGTSMSYVFNTDHYSFEKLGWGEIRFFNRSADFTILSVNQPAPVPLPMSAALLPLGIGALGVMRRRRRRI